MKVCVEVLEQVSRFQDEKSLRVGATEFSKKEDFVARNGGFCIFAAVQFVLGAERLVFLWICHGVVAFASKVSADLAHIAYSQVAE